MIVQNQQLETLIEKSVIKALENYSSSKHNPQPTKEYYTRKELAKLLNCSVSTIYNWTVLGKLKAVGIGNRVLYPVHEVNASLINL